MPECPGGTNDASPAIYCWEASPNRISAVGTAENGDPPESLSRLSWTELPLSRNPSNKLQG